MAGKGLERRNTAIQRGRATGAYFRGTNALAFDSEGQRLRMRFGWKGFGIYMGLLCVLVNQPGAVLDLSDTDAWDALAFQMAGDVDAEELREIVAYLASRGLADASALGDGVLSMPESDQALAAYEKKSSAGVASGRARRKKALEGPK